MSTPALEIAVDFALAQDVVSGLCRSGQKELPSKYLYDELGSILFDAITVLPEYGLTRAETRILSRHARDMVSALPHSLAVAELGSGTGTKTRYILEAAAPVRYFPIDISPTALEACTTSLADIPGVRTETILGTYLEGLAAAAAHRLPGETLLVLFLGSTIGNFDRSGVHSFLRDVRLALRPGDALLLGTDLVKPLPQLIAAYDDPVGVTRAFNLNLLARINRELDADFDLSQFEHEARFNDDESRIEMHIRSSAAQVVRLAALDKTVHFDKGETIWTEGSHKFRRSDIAEMADRAGFTLQQQWVDEAWPFAESLLLVE